MLNFRIPGDTYVTRPEELELLPHAAEAARALSARGYAIVVVTNQRGVARGFMDEEALTAVHARLRELLAAGGAEVAAIYHCPHDRHTGCPCRKPAPGMLLRAADDLGLDLARSVLIGDSEHDVEAGRRAGLARSVLIPSNSDLRAALDEIPSV